MMDSCVVLGSSVDVLVRLPRRCPARIRHATRVRMLRDTLVQRFIRKHCNEHPLHAYKPPVLSFASEQHAHAVHTSSFRSFYIEATLGCSNMRPAGRWRWREVYVVLGRPVRKLTHREFTGLLASWNPFRAGDESSGLCDQDRGGIRQQYATASLPSPEKHCLFCLFGKECSTWDSITAAIACGTTSVTALVAGSLDRSQYLYSI